MKRCIVTLAWVLATAILASAQTTTTYMPQVAVGDAGDVIWLTSLGIMNPAPIGAPNADVTITFFKSDGTPFNVANVFYNLITNQPGGTGNTLTFQLPGGGSRFFSADPSSLSLGVGYARVTSTTPINATSVFLSYSKALEVSVGEAGVAAAPALSRQALFAVHSSDEDTAIAVANPNAAAATVTFTLYNTGGGVQFTPVVRTLQANNQSAFFMAELFPGLTSTFLGTIRITTADATPVAATSLLFHPDAQFSGLPIVPLQ